MSELVDQLREFAQRGINAAEMLRDAAPSASFMLWKMAELMEKAECELKRNIPQDMETEGGGSTWFLVCPECHGAVDPKDSYCRHCGQALKK